MRIEYSNRISKYIKDESTIIKFYGKLSRSIIVCISVLIAADYLSDVPNVPPTRRHKLNDGTWAIDVSKNWRMIVRPLNGNVPSNIDAIEIVSIEDYH